MPKTPLKKVPLPTLDEKEIFCPKSKQLLGFRWNFTGSKVRNKKLTRLRTEHCILHINSLALLRVSRHQCQIREAITELRVLFIIKFSRLNCISSWTKLHSICEIVIGQQPVELKRFSTVEWVNGLLTFSVHVSNQCNACSNIISWLLPCCQHSYPAI